MEDPAAQQRALTEANKRVLQEAFFMKRATVSHTNVQLRNCRGEASISDMCGGLFCVMWGRVFSNCLAAPGTIFFSLFFSGFYCTRREMERSCMVLRTAPLQWIGRKIVREGHLVSISTAIFACRMSFLQGYGWYLCALRRLFSVSTDRETFGHVRAVRCFLPSRPVPMFCIPCTPVSRASTARS